MAIVNNTQLASELSVYLNAAVNTAGTPIDTNELVRIMNKYLGEGSQISSDSTAISFGIYKTFGSSDKIANRTEIVTSGIWANDSGSLTTFFTSSLQKASTSGQYYWEVHNSAATNSVQFSITYGDYDGYGAPTLTQDNNSLLTTTAIYFQLANVLLDESTTYFTVYSGSIPNGYQMHEFYALNINRERYRERLDPGNISIDLKGPLGEAVLIDDSGGTNETVTTSGRVYNLVSGSLNIGTSLNSTIQSYTSSNGLGWGLFYPDMGIILLNPLALGAKVASGLNPATSSAAGFYHMNTGSLALFQALQSGSLFAARRTENVSTAHYFVRANNREYNFSNNPSFITGSIGQFSQPTFETDPHVYITTIGLYDDSNELLAVAKTSMPVEKSFDKELSIRVKLDF
jgi:hypothetical protein